MVFGNGLIRWSVDTGQNQASLLRIAGDVNREAAGNEIWIDDVTGDGLTNFITNEMTENGVAPGTEDVGNPIFISGQLLSAAFSPILLAQFGSGSVISEILVSNPATALEKCASLRRDQCQ